MDKIMVTLSDELGNRLREHLIKQGDLSRIVRGADRLPRQDREESKEVKLSPMPGIATKVILSSIIFGGPTS